jgi:hypothetical protein
VWVCVYKIRAHHSLTHGAEPFLRSCQLYSYSRTSQRFMEPEGSLPRSQEPSIGPYSEPDQSNPCHPILPKIHFNIAHPPTSWSSQWSLSFWNSHQYPICIPLIPHSCYMTCPSHPPWLVHSNYTWRRVQVMKHLKLKHIYFPNSLCGILHNTGSDVHLLMT